VPRGPADVIWPAFGFNTAPPSDDAMKIAEFGAP
jgi:hypothetical protein